MAKNAHSTDKRSSEDTLAVTGRRRLAAGLLATIAGGALTAGIAAGASAAAAEVLPVDFDAELIEACACFSAIELRCNEVGNAARTMEEDERADEFTAQLREETDEQRHWPALNRICTTSGSSHAAAVALASALAVWNRGAVEAAEDDPDNYVGDRITAALMRCLLGSASA